VTGENRRENLVIEVEKADASLRAADLCLHAGLFDDAVSRAYYAAFHMVQALLLTLGLESRTHGGAHDLFYVQFVRTGQIAPHVAKRFAALQKFREQADYARAFHFTGDDAREEVTSARAICVELRARLVNDGWIKEAG
jgi:uncharacterized protein (UPF0332 family)